MNGEVLDRETLWTEKMCVIIDKEKFSFVWLSQFTPAYVHVCLFPALVIRMTGQTVLDKLVVAGTDRLPNKQYWRVVNVQF